MAEQKIAEKSILSQHGPITGAQAVTIAFTMFAVKMAAKCRNSAFIHSILICRLHGTACIVTSIPVEHFGEKEVGCH